MIDLKSQVNNHDWASILAFINAHHRLLLTTHLNPDGDALGSELALAYYLQQIHKEPVIINSSHTPRQYQFLDRHELVRHYQSERDLNVIRSCDGAIILDLSDWRRVDRVGEAIRKFQIPAICIDHHLNGDKIGAVQIIDENASSTGELIYDFLQFCRADLSRDMAEALYICIMTDTGSFRFTNTNANAHRIVADLMDRGISFRKLYESVYENNTPGLFELKGQVMSSLRYESDGKLAWFVITNSMMQKAGVRRSELEGFAEIPREITGVEVVIMFTETEDHQVKLSLRSRGNIAINGLANQFGGGGHKFAAGAVFQEPIWAVVEKVLPFAIRLCTESSDLGH